MGKPVGLLLWKKGNRKMPKKPKRPCSYPGCPRLTDGRFCLEHEKQENKRYEQYDRSPEVKKRYGRVWKRIRDSYAKEHPLCELCLERGIYKPTEEVHHRLPLAEEIDGEPNLNIIGRGESNL